MNFELAQRGAFFLVTHFAFVCVLIEARTDYELALSYSTWLGKC